MLISFPTIDWMGELKYVYYMDAHLKELLQQYSEDKLGSKYTIREGLLLYKNKLYIPNDEKFKRKLMELTHSSP